MILKSRGGNGSSLVFRCNAGCVYYTFQICITDIYQFSIIKYQFLNEMLFDTSHQYYSFVLNSE